MDTRIKYVADINKRTLSADTDTSLRFRYVDISAVDGMGGITIPDELISFQDSPSRARRLAQPGDTLVSTVRTYLRAVARVPSHSDPLVFSTGFAILTPGPQLDGRYLSYYCMSDSFIEEVVARSVGVSYPAINPAEIGDLSLPERTLDDQQRVADYLDVETTRLDRLVQAQQRVKRKALERREAGVVASVIGRELLERRLASLAWVDTLPIDWQEVRLGLVAKMGSGHTPSRSHPEWWTDCTIPWITTGEVSQVRDDRLETITETREKISELGLENSSAELHPAGTVVLCRTANSAGYSAVMGTDMATSQDIVTWTCGPRLDPYYLLWCLRAMRQDLLGRLAMGSTHKTIYVPDLQMLRIPLPPIPEQRKIVDEIREQNRRIDRLVDAIDRQLALLAERRTALITAAVTGQFDVSSASGRGVCHP